ncbi:YtxH-like protein [bacterium BMS3Abin03]|nr:YtxH-like protein [bacterium BMS3Abin03]
MSEESNLGKGVIIGFIAGGALGAALALLYAPKSGKELRQDIKIKTDDYFDEAEKYIAEAKDKAIDLINEGKKKSEKIIKDAKIKSEELLKDAEKVLEEARSKTDELVKTGKEKVDKKTGQLKSAIKAGVDAYKETKNT